MVHLTEGVKEALEVIKCNCGGTSCSTTCTHAKLHNTLSILEGLEDISKSPKLYGPEHPTYPKADWRYEVMNQNTVLGYWPWVSHQKEITDEIHVRQTGKAK